LACMNHLTLLGQSQLGCHLGELQSVL